MRVIHLTRRAPGQGVGGVEHHVYYLSRALNEVGIESLVLHLDFDGPPGNGTHALAGISHHRIGVGHLSLLMHLPEVLTRRSSGELLFTLIDRITCNAHAGRLVQEVLRFKPNVIHQHDYLASIRLSWKLASHAPVVLTNHLGEYLFLQRTAATRLLQRKILAAFDQVIAPSRELCPPQSNSHYIPNGFDPRVFRQADDAERAHRRAEWGYGDRVVFVCARRWAPTKGVEYLATALGLLSPSARARCAFLFAGHDSYGFSHYRQRVKERLASVDGLAIRFLGNLEHAVLARVVAAADVAVLPSVMEATSLFCLEAMASGVPILATRTGGLKDLVQDGRTGWLVTPEKPAELSRAIESICRSPQEELKARGRAARLLASTEYTWRHIAERTKTVYELALEARCLPGASRDDAW